MHIIIRSLFAFTIALLMTLYLVPLLISVAHKLNVIDSPDGNLKQHKEPTPYLGGIAVYIGFLTSLALTFPFYNRLFLLLVGSSLLLFFGLIDDLIILKPYQKFAGQMIAAFCFLKGGFYLKETFLYASGSTTVFLWWLFVSYMWILTIINAFNLIDVMDGLATTVAICVTASFLILAFIFKASLIIVLMSSFLGALIAFLWFNRPKAKIYLGDSGSLFIGGFLAVIPFLFTWGTYQPYGFLAPVIILLIPLLEVSALICMRTARGIPFYYGSPDHFSHYLRNKGWQITHILEFVVALAMVLFMIALLFVLGKISVVALFFSLGIVFLFWGTTIFGPRLFN